MLRIDHTELVLYNSGPRSSSLAFAICSVAPFSQMSACSLVFCLCTQRAHWLSIEKRLWGNDCNHTACFKYNYLSEASYRTAHWDWKASSASRCCVFFFYERTFHGMSAAAVLCMKCSYGLLRNMPLVICTVVMFISSVSAHLAIFYYLLIFVKQLLKKNNSSGPELWQI